MHISNEAEGVNSDLNSIAPIRIQSLQVFLKIPVERHLSSTTVLANSDVDDRRLDAGHEYLNHESAIETLLTSLHALLLD